jgi:ribosomal protein L40E
MEKTGCLQAFTLEAAVQECSSADIVVRGATIGHLPGGGSRRQVTFVGTTQTRKPSTRYIYLTIMFSVLSLAWGSWANYSALNYQQQGNMESFYFYAIAGSAATVLGILGIVREVPRVSLPKRSYRRQMLAEAVLCSRCGQENPAPSSFCNRCGRALRPKDTMDDEVKEW